MSEPIPDEYFTEFPEDREFEIVDVIDEFPECTLYAVQYPDGSTGFRSLPREVLI